MSTEPRAVLYSFRRCPFAIRARLAIDIAQRPCELREVVLAAKPAALLAASPKATVPVWIDAQAGVIDQSLDIMRHVLAQGGCVSHLPAPDPDHVMHAWVQTCDGAFKHHLDRYKYASRYVTPPVLTGNARLPNVPLEHAVTPIDTPGDGAEPASAAEASASLHHRACAAAFIRTLDAQLRITEHLAGQAQGWPDLAIAPFIRQFRQADAEWFDQQPWPGVHGWLHRFVQDPRFVRIMQKFPPWREGEEGVPFPLDEISAERGKVLAHASPRER